MKFLQVSRLIARRQLDKWGGHIHIFVFCTINFFKIDLISKEINCAEQEYMNMSPSLIELATPLPSMWYVEDWKIDFKTKIQPMAIAYTVGLLK